MPKLFVLPALEGLPNRQQLEEHRLTDVLRVLGGFEVGIAQPKNEVGIGIYQTFRLLPVHFLHVVLSFKGAFTDNTIEKAES